MVATQGAVRNRRGTLRQRPGGTAHYHHGLCACTPEMRACALGACCHGVHSTPPFVDSLETLLASLAARGLTYRVAAVVNNIWAAASSQARLLTHGPTLLATLA